MYPSDRLYTKDHEWISVSGATARVGITDYAQQQLGDVVFIELPDVGQVFDVDEAIERGNAAGAADVVPGGRRHL